MAFQDLKFINDKSKGLKERRKQQTRQWKMKFPSWGVAETNFPWLLWDEENSNFVIAASFVKIEIIIQWRWESILLSLEKYTSIEN